MWTATETKRKDWGCERRQNGQQRGRRRRRSSALAGPAGERRRGGGAQGAGRGGGARSRRNDAAPDVGQGCRDPGPAPLAAGRARSAPAALAVVRGGDAGGGGRGDDF